MVLGTHQNGKKKTDNIKFEEKVDQLEVFYTADKNIIW